MEFRKATFDFFFRNDKTVFFFYFMRHEFNNAQIRLKTTFSKMVLIVLVA